MQNAKMSVSPHAIWVSGDLRASNLAEYGCDLDALWDIELNQLQASQTDFRCHFVTDGQAIVYEELYGARAAVRGALRGARMGFALSNAIGCSGCWKGRPLPDFAIAYTHGQRDVDVQWQPGTSNIVVIMSREMFANRFEPLCGRPIEKAFSPAAMYLRLSPQSWTNLRERLRRVLRGEQAKTDGSLQEELADTIIEACYDRFDDLGKDSPAAWFHFRRALSHLTLDESPLRVTELARDMGLTIRSLETAFQSCVGMPPAKYLRRARLNRVHKDLLEHGPSDTTVTDLAMRHGFTELGRFAGEYRRVFNEKPVQTLHRRTRGVTITLPGLD